MVKYITIDSANDGVIHIPLCSGLFAKHNGATTSNLFYIQGLDADSTETGLQQVRSYIQLRGTGLTQALTDNINDAIERAITSNWREVAHAVTIPSGAAVTSFDIVYEEL
tara:strand:+ start:17587 stop:17916 length:330 start_codon:yes stop_codon:yes gene_type:complete